MNKSDMLKLYLDELKSAQKYDKLMNMTDNETYKQTYKQMHDNELMHARNLIKMNEQLEDEVADLKEIYSYMMK